MPLLDLSQFGLPTMPNGMLSPIPGQFDQPPPVDEAAAAQAAREAAAQRLAAAQQRPVPPMPSVPPVDTFGMPGGPSPFGSLAPSLDTAPPAAPTLPPWLSEMASAGPSKAGPPQMAPPMPAPVDPAALPVNATPTVGAAPAGLPLPDNVAPREPRGPLDILPPAPAAAPQPAAAAVPGSASLLDRLSAASSNLGARPGLPGIFDAITGATTGQRLDPLGRQLQAENQTVQALVKKGIEPDMASAISKNPTLLQQIVPQLFGPKKYEHLTIKDSLGNEIPMTFDPSTGKYKPGIDGQAGATGPTTAATALPIVIDPKTGRDEAFMSALSPTDRSAVEGLLAGDVNAQGRNMQKYLPYAARAQPGFSQQTYMTRLGTMKDFEPQGVSGKNLTAISTGLGHADRLMGAIDKLDNYTIAPGIINPIRNAIRGQTDPEYQKNVSTYRNDVNALSGELAKAFRSSGMSEADISSWRKSFEENASPVTMKAAAHEAVHLLDSRLEVIGAAYNRGMGLGSTKPPPELLSPEGQRVHQKMLQTEAAPSVAAAPPSAAAALKANPALRDQFDAKYGAGASASVLGTH